MVQQGARSFAGETVTFAVNGEIASQSATWRHGGIDLIDLTVYSGLSSVTDVFAELIDDGSLTAIWKYHNSTKSWTVFDPRPEAAELVDLTEVSAGDILWVNVSEQRVFQGRVLYQGWNLVALR